MDGLRVNAKGKQVGFHLVMLKEGTESLQARWQKYFEVSGWFLALRVHVLVCD
jgi:hypothetical protein